MDNNIEIESVTSGTPAPAPKKSRWRKAFKIVGWTLFGLVILLLLLLCGVTWFLSPSTLTPLIEDVAKEHLNADVTIKRAELTFWKSFPNLNVVVNDLDIRSKSLENLPDNISVEIPVGADSLLHIGRFEGSINILSALSGKIALKDVLIDSPRIRLVQVNDTISNFNIFPTSPPDTTKTQIPEISINRFAITNAQPITYKSIRDSIDISLLLNTIQLEDKTAPRYSLTVDTHIESPMLRAVAYKEVKFSLDGGIGWSAHEPYKLKLEDLDVQLAELALRLSSDIDFTDNLRIETLDIDMHTLDLTPLIVHLPEKYKALAKPLDTDMAIAAKIKLDRPYTLADSLTIPFATVNVNIPDCHIYYKELHFNSVIADITAIINGSDPNRSEVNVNKFVIDGRAVDINLTGTLTNLLTNPHISAHLLGDVDFNRLPKRLTSLLGSEVYGRLHADARFAFAVNDLTKNRFHKISANGDVTLSHFMYQTPDDVTGAFTRKATLHFGSSETLTQNGHTVDSMLIVRIAADTASFHTDGIIATMADLKAALGATNNATLADTTVITPFGGSINIKRLSYNSLEDSVKIRIADATGIAMLRRYEGDEKLPKLGLKFNISRLGMIDRNLVVGVSQSHLDIQANLRPRRQPGAMLTAADSLRRVTYRDSINRNRLSAAQFDSIGAQIIDFNVDNSLKSLLFRWNIHGQLTAERGRMRFNAIKLPNSFSDLDIILDTDSVALNSLKYKLGRSDFNFHGVVSNLRRALLSRHPQPLRIDLNVVSDTININQVVRALSQTAVKKVDDTADDAEIWADQELKEIEHHGEEGDSIMGPLLVPVNIDAGFTINAANVIYSDLLLKDLRGQLLVYHGVVNLHNLSARTDIGSIDLSALYSAPTPKDMNFGLGMNLSDFRIDRLPQVIPAIDSIMPMMKSLSGIVNAQLALTSDLTPDMYLDMKSFKAAMKFEGDSLVVFDNETFRKLSKWLMFKNKHHNMIDRLEVEATVENGILNVYPFIIDIDRYKLGVMGNNNLDLNLNYHISVLKSPIPFKFGINIKGTPDHMKIRFGGAKFKDKMVAEKSTIANDTRINLITEMNNAFRRGLRAARLGPLNISSKADTTYMSAPEAIITAADSVAMIREGLIQAPDTTAIKAPLGK